MPKFTKESVVQISSFLMKKSPFFMVEIVAKLINSFILHIPTKVSHQSGKVSHLKVVDFWEANFC
jgi:hypothetical protein